MTCIVRTNVDFLCCKKKTPDPFLSSPTEFSRPEADTIIAGAVRHRSAVIETEKARRADTTILNTLCRPSGVLVCVLHRFRGFTAPAVIVSASGLKLNIVPSHGSFTARGAMLRLGCVSSQGNSGRDRPASSGSHLHGSDCAGITAGMAVKSPSRYSWCFQKRRDDA